MADYYDYIVVGAGTAGCVLASRLSEDPKRSVLLLEAGGLDSSLLVRIPFGAHQISFDPKFNWGYRTQPCAQLNNRSLLWPRAKLVGGCSSTNGMIYVRGQPQDYDDWAALGNAGWSWEDVLPYFRRSEDFAFGESDYHGVGGAIHVSEAERSRIGDVYIDACREQGIPTREDFNSGKQAGAGYYQVAIKEGRRQSAAVGYLNTAIKRPNLRLIPGAHAQKLILEHGVCQGVQYLRGGEQFEARVRTELLLAAGVVNSPQLLQLSGIGPRALLEGLGIEVQQELPGVGENLQDHLGVVVAQEICEPLTLAHQFLPHRLLYQLYQYARFNRGFLNLPAAPVGAFWYSERGLDRPDLQLHLALASGFRDDQGKSHIDRKKGVTSMVNPLRPESRGSVRIYSANPADLPEIDANYMATDYDQRAMIASVKLQRQIFASPAFDELRGDEIRPGPDVAVETDEQILEYVRNHSVTAYHPVGTCKMGNDPMAVVDNQLRVRGVERLRVVDASIMPGLISGNTNAATTVIAEKAVDLIRNSPV